MDKFLTNLDPSLNDEVLTSLIEGTLAPAEQARVEAMIARDPEAARLVAAIRGDRAAMVSLPKAAAPTGLVAAIEARLDQAAMAQLVEPAAHANIPISKVRVERPSPFQIFTESVWPRRLALAAGVLIALGVGYYGIQWSVNNWPSSSTPIANRDAHPADDARTAPPTVDPPVDVAANINENHLPTETLVPAAPAPEAVAASVTPEPAALTEAQAASLAREGRLVIVVRTDDPEGTIKRVDALARTSRDGAWRSFDMDRVPEQYIALAQPTAIEQPAAPVSPRPEPPTVASEHAGKGTHVGGNDEPPATLPTPTHAVVKKMYAVQVLGQESEITSLMKALTSPRQAARLRVLDQPLATPLALDPDSVLWWTGPSSRWAKRAGVPVIVETPE